MPSSKEKETQGKLKEEDRKKKREKNKLKLGKFLHKSFMRGDDTKSHVFLSNPIKRVSGGKGKRRKIIFLFFFLPANSQ